MSSELKPVFTPNPDVLATDDEQRQAFDSWWAYQVKPIPCFDDVARANVVPRFNPTAADPDAAYPRGRIPTDLLERGWRVGEDASNMLQLWRIVERSRLVDGTGLTSSAVVQTGTVGDVESFDAIHHLVSNHEKRVADTTTLTPFVSCSTDPEHLATVMIGRHGFGVRDGRDSVVVRLVVASDRVVGGDNPKMQEVLLLGGVAPGEYIEAYEIADFANVFHVDVSMGIGYAATLSAQAKKDNP